MSAPATPPAPLRRTALFPFHQAHGAHLVPFAGYEMPLYFQGILAEHRAVRTGVGLFDVSHMGILHLTGGSAARLIARRTTTNAAQIRPGKCHYSFLLEASGAILDDLLITRLDAAEAGPMEFLMVPNAATAQGVFDLLRSHRRPDTEVTRHNDTVSILAVQGPQSREVLEAEFGWKLAGLKFYNGRWFPGPGAPGADPDGTLSRAWPDDIGSYFFVSRTGYTGELGYELFVPSSAAGAIAETLLARGVVPCGLGARDTLRLEKGYLLSGQDFNRDRTPIEAGQQKFVELDHPFIGREAVEKQVLEGPPVLFAGLQVDDPGAIPRHGSPIQVDGAPAGVATSGGISPTLEIGIALAYLPPNRTAPGTPVQIEVRGRPVPAHVVKLPFVPAVPARA